VIIQCATCGMDCRKSPWEVKKFRFLYCGRVCHAKGQRNQITKKCKICEALFSVRVSEAKKFSTCGRECYLKAKSKENNGNWQGGIGNPRVAELSTKRYKDWRDAVYARDNYTCVDCGKRGGDIEADHIKPWAYFVDLRYDLDNGATRCKPCHRKRTALVFGWKRLLISEGSLTPVERRIKEVRVLRCAECSAEFTAKSWNTKFCSRRCTGKFHQRILRSRRGMKVRPPIRPGAWSRLYDQCIDCGTADRPCVAFGRCGHCYHANKKVLLIR